MHKDEAKEVCKSAEIEYSEELSVYPRRFVVSDKVSDVQATASVGSG